MSFSCTEKQTKREENHLMEDKKKKKQEEKKKKDAPKKVRSTEAMENNWATFAGCEILNNL